MSKGGFDLNSTIDQFDLIDIYGVFHLTTVEYTFFSSSYDTFIRIDHSLDHKTHFHKFRRIKVIPCMFSDHNGIKQKLTILINDEDEE